MRRRVQNKIWTFSITAFPHSSYLQFRLRSSSKIIFLRWSDSLVAWRLSHKWRCIVPVVDMIPFRIKQLLPQLRSSSSVQPSPTSFNFIWVIFQRWVHSVYFCSILPSLIAAASPFKVAILRDATIYWPWGVCLSTILTYGASLNLFLSRVPCLSWICVDGGK